MSRDFWIGFGAGAGLVLLWWYWHSHCPTCQRQWALLKRRIGLRMVE